MLVEEEFKIHSDSYLEKNIKEREIKNNYKNCDYLINYYISTYKDNKSGSLNIMIFDLRSNKDIMGNNRTIGFYSIKADDGSMFNKKLQTEIIDDMLTKWWKTQTTQPPKARPLEVWCVGDNCDKNERI